jgi:DNA-binding transcriptional ArsR family regulator
MAKYGSRLSEILALTGALADENRVRIVAACRKGELCVCQVTELLRLAPSTVSKHLSILKNSGLLESRKQGRWIYYRVPPSTRPLVRAMLECVFAHLSAESRLSDDSRALKAILKADPEQLCLKQRCGPSECR